MKAMQQDSTQKLTRLRELVQRKDELSKEAQAIDDEINEILELGAPRKVSRSMLSDTARKAMFAGFLREAKTRERVKA